MRRLAGNARSGVLADPQTRGREYGSCDDRLAPNAARRRLIGMPDTLPTKHCTGAPRKLVLASSSPRRRQLLHDLGLSFSVDSSDVDETVEPGASIASVVSTLALAKARDVAQRHPDALVIGADTLVALNTRILGKPRDADDARDMLRSLSDNCHRVYTGLVALDAATQIYESRLVETDVYFRELTDAEIDAYLRTDEPFDKAGSYGAQGLGSTFVRRIDGDYFNVVGLPLAELNDLLRGFGACVICRRLQSDRRD